MARKGGSMKAVCIKEYVKELSEIQPSWVPVPTFPDLTRGGSDVNKSLVLVRVTHTSPTHVDGLYARGLHQNNHSGLVRPPFTLGLEFSGVVVGVASSKSSGFKKGDKVWGTCTGSFAGFVMCPAEVLHLVPGSLSLADAAGLGASTAPVSYGALVRVGELKEGETALIHAAAGGLGVAAVMIARAVGANVIGTVGSQEKAEVIRNLLGDEDGKMAAGCDVIRYDRDGWEKQVLSSTQGRGVDVVFDTVGLVGKSIRCCRFGGRIVIVGFVGLGGKMENVAMNRVLLKGVKVMGYRFGETSRRDPGENIRTWQGFDELVAAGSVRPVVHKTYSGLDSVPAALHQLASRTVSGKIVIEVTQEDTQEDTQEPAESDSRAVQRGQGGSRL